MERDCVSDPILWVEGLTPFLLQAAQVAGEELKVIFDNHGRFDLKFKGKIKGGFLSMDDAKSYAPFYVREVIACSEVASATIH